MSAPLLPACESCHHPAASHAHYHPEITAGKVTVFYFSCDRCACKCYEIRVPEPRMCSVISARELL